MFQNNVVKIGDLNVSKTARKDGLNYTQAGTPYYSSPEVWKDVPYDFKSDVWSLGCIIYELTCMVLPFQARDMAELFKRVIKGEYKSIPKVYSRGLSEIIERTLTVNSKKRISIRNCNLITCFRGLTTVAAGSC
jgi:NIMA (never in mitosis gene a)-related kinase